MFLISNTGITIAQLYQVPLSLAEVIPASAAAGAMVTLTGSGFQKRGNRTTFGTTQVPGTLCEFEHPPSQRSELALGTASGNDKQP